MRNLIMERKQKDWGGKWKKLPYNNVFLLHIALCGFYHDPKTFVLSL